ncbi:MAG: hypothetical protein KDC92_17565 [Bacteroidetes bacterium]|nr:hypothetical protein [Bacteroidota bacterium]
MRITLLTLIAGIMLFACEPIIGNKAAKQGEKPTLTSNDNVDIVSEFGPKLVAEMVDAADFLKSGVATIEIRIDNDSMVVYNDAIEIIATDNLGKKHTVTMREKRAYFKPKELKAGENKFHFELKCLLTNGLTEKISTTHTFIASGI